MKKIVTLLALVALCSPVFAAAHTVEVSAKGQGSTRDRAIQNGLYQAVCQAQGMKVSSGVASVDVSVGNLDVTRDEAKGTKKVEAEKVSANVAGTVTLTEAKGLVKSFDVVEEKQVGPDAYEVTVKAQVYDYQSPEDSRQTRVAVFPFESRAEVHKFGTAIVPGKRLGEQFSQQLNTMLAKNEKFTVLDREAGDTLAKEKEILKSDAPLAEQARLGQSLGADYVLTGTIPQAELTVEEVAVPAIGATTQRYKAIIEVEYRLIVASTRQVAVSDQLRIVLVDDQVKALVARVKSAEVDWNDFEQQLVQMAAGQIADSVMEHLYPVRVAAVRDDGTLILNQGGKRFADGDFFELSKGGTDVIDPDTGKSLGKEEMSLGVIRVVRVLPRISYAELMKGTAGSSLVGSMCRRLQADNSSQSPEWRGSNIQQTGSGGVKLPSDDRGPSKVNRSK